MKPGVGIPMRRTNSSPGVPTYSRLSADERLGGLCQYFAGRAVPTSIGCLDPVKQPASMSNITIWTTPFMRLSTSSNAKLTDDEERAKGVRIATAE